MGKLKNPPFCTKFTRVRVIPSVTTREKMTLFSFGSLLLQQKNWTYKRYRRKKTKVCGKFQLSIDLKMRYK